VALAARSAPESRVLLACVALGAAWETHAQTLLGVGLPVLSAVIQAVLWMALYAVLVVALGTVAPANGQSVSRVSRRLGMALLLGLASAHLVKLAMSPLLEPPGWHAYRYLRLLLAPGLAVLWCVALLPREVGALVRATRRREALAPLPALAVLLVAAAVLASCSDLAFQFVRQGSAMQNRLGTDVITWPAWLTTTAILFLVEALVYAVTSSAATALVLVSPIFATMVFATLVKIRFMHSAVQPLDLLTLPEFMPLFGAFFGTWAAIGSAIAIACWLVALVVLWRRTRGHIPAGRRVALGATSFVLLTALVVAFFPPSVLPPPLDAQGDAMYSAVTTLGAPRGEHRDMVRNGGIVLNFLSELQSAFVVVPQGYSAARIAGVTRAYRAASLPLTRRHGGVSLVVYLVESFMDPDDLGFRYTSDPIAKLRALRREQVGGYAIVPKSYGGSANTEFEVLTGMSTSFLPDGSIPYRQHIRWPIPGLARTLHDLGYSTVAVQADAKYYYDRERVYPLLGFDRTVWLHEAKVPRADRGGWPSDGVLVDSVIAAASHSHPTFVFAFPSSTHSPYNVGTYATSDLDVTDAPAAARAEVKEYINAERVADGAIARLIEHFRSSPDSTIVVVFGDHLPPVSTDARVRLSERISKLSEAEQTRETRRVPLLVWANFGLPHSEPTLSVNMIAPFVLERMGIARTGLFAVTDSVRRILPVVSACVESVDGRLWLPATVPPALRGPIEDYRVMQYDLLLGERYAGKR
jgi:hypothetical protein